MQLPRIGIDSNCLSYLIDAASGEKGAATAILEEGIALVRIWFYSTDRFSVTATVAAECSQIKNPTKNAVHAAFTSQGYWGVLVRNAEATCKRADALEHLHSGRGDRLALAEAEDAELDILLTYDKDFLKLGSSSGSPVRLIKPTVYWKQLNVPRGTRPSNLPTAGNPLETQRWWVW